MLGQVCTYHLVSAVQATTAPQDQALQHRMQTHPTPHSQLVQNALLVITALKAASCQLHVILEHITTGLRAIPAPHASHALLGVIALILGCLACLVNVKRVTSVNWVQSLALHLLHCAQQDSTALKAVELRCHATLVCISHKMVQVRAWLFQKVDMRQAT